MTQAEKNLSQGSIGQTLGITRTLALTMHAKELSNNLEAEINNISKEKGIAEEDNQEHFEEEFTQIKKVIKNIHMMTPQIEKLETDLGILDAQANEKD